LADDEQEHGINTTSYILDVRDLDNPPEPKAFTHETSSIDHNMYAREGRVFQSNYMAGLRILDYDNESLEAGQLNEVAFFDVVPGGDIAEFAGTWSNYQFDSGTVVVSTIENEVSGLFVLRPTLPARTEEGPQGPDGGGTTQPTGPGKSGDTPANEKRRGGPKSA
jgi:choice-of-anchor B domain-containing protein